MRRGRARRAVVLVATVALFVGAAVYSVSTDNPLNPLRSDAAAPVEGLVNANVREDGTVEPGITDDNGLDALADPTDPEAGFADGFAVGDLAGGGDGGSGGGSSGPGATRRRPTPPEPRCVTSDAGAPLSPRAGWEASWETRPKPNDPLVLRLCVDDVTPAIGQRVVATITADDPDALIFDGPCDVEIRWEPDDDDFCRTIVDDADLGRRPTPAEEHGHQSLRFEHRYDTAGQVSVFARAWSGEDDGREHPYKSYGSVHLTLSVHPA